MALTVASNGGDFDEYVLYWGADKFLARTGRKQPTTTKLGIYSTYSPRSSIHVLARCSNFCTPLKNNSECCPSNQVSVAVMTFASDEKWRPFNCFFTRVGLRTYQHPCMGRGSKQILA